jgi:hypothetical protein
LENKRKKKIHVRKKELVVRERDCYCVKKKACHEESGAMKCDVQQKELKP